MRKIILLVLSGNLWNSSLAKNNVCSEFSSYLSLQKNSNCWFNPDVQARPEDIIINHGYPLEKYEIETKDGYILSLFRIPSNGSKTTEEKHIALLHPGLACDASFYLLMGNASMCFIFSNEGYDVWIVNPRGTIYSQQHIKYTINDEQFWKFSFHEMAVYDLPAILNFINTKTGNSNPIKYVGHSMGTSVAFAYASLYPSEAQKHIASIIALGPVAFSGNSMSIVRLIAPTRLFIWKLLKSLHIYGSSPSWESVIQRIKNVCASYPYMIYCQFVADLLSGFNEGRLLPQLLPVVFSNYPTHFSIQNVVHLLQLFVAESQFRYLDYGFYKNIQMYNQSVPPEYPLAEINIPVHLFYGNNDFLASKSGAEILYNLLNTTKTIKGFDRFGHLNFAASTLASELSYNLTKL